MMTPEDRNWFSIPEPPKHPKYKPGMNTTATEAWVLGAAYEVFRGAREHVTLLLNRHNENETFYNAETINGAKYLMHSIKHQIDVLNQMRGNITTSRNPVIEIVMVMGREVDPNYKNEKISLSSLLDGLTHIKSTFEAAIATEKKAISKTDKTASLHNDDPQNNDAPSVDDDDSQNNNSPGL